jgi:hypothetical protein
VSLTKIRDGRSRLYGPLTLLHASKTGGPVLREQGSWRTVNGVMVSTPRGTWCWTFRRRP